MSSDAYLLGIDYGTESCRVAIFDLAGRPVTFAATPYATKYPRSGWAEQSPADWWEALQASSARALANAGIPASAIAGISYDATTMTVVPMDAKGQELRDAIMWMDVRATEQAARAQSSDSVARLYNGAGTAPATAEWFPFKAAWLKENEPETYNKAVHLVDAPDWLTYKLTGEWTVNINSAAHRMYYNRDHGGWPVDFYEHIGCGDVFSKVPERVLDLGTPVGTLSVIAAQLLGLRPGIPVAQGAADVANALRQRLVADRHVGPYRIQELFLAHDTAGMFEQAAQHFEAFRPQARPAGAPVQAKPFQIEGE